MAAIDRFGAAKDGFSSARTKFREAQVAVEKAAVAMKRGQGDADALARSYEKAQAAVSRASAAFERQRSAFVGAKRGLEEFGVPINRAVSQQEKLRAAVDRTNAALDRQAAKSERSARRRQMISNAAGLAGGFLAHEAKRGAGNVLHTYREFDKERRFGKAVMGLSDAEQAPLVAQAIHMGAKTKYNDVQVLEAQRELAARGLNKNQVMGMMEPAASLGMSMDLTLPDAVKQMEGAIFGFRKDTSTQEAALAAARQTADYQVKAAKVTGMTPEDISQLYKFGATPARLAGISEASLLGFGGVLKKANIRGDEAGTAFRALTAMTQAPTAGAKTALLAAGMDYKNYQTMRDHLDVDPFAADVAARYGVKLNGATKAGLGKIFSNKDVIADPAKFGPAVTSLLRDSLEGNDAKSLKSIAGAAQRYRNASVQSVDANALIKDLMPKLAGNLPLANALFGSKQGGRIATALSDEGTLRHVIEEIEKNSSGYSEKIAGERMSGFDGAVSRLEGSIKNLETAIGRAFDNDGKGGPLTWATDMLGKGVQGTAELPPWAVGAGAAAAAGGGIYGGVKFAQTIFGGFGLSSSAVALDGSAAALTAAAAELSAAAGVKSIPDAVKNAAPAATSAAASSWWALGAAAVPWLGAGAATIGGLYAMHKSVEDAGYSGLTSGERLRLQRGSMRDVYRRAFGYDELSSPEVSPTMTYGTGVAGDKLVQAQLTGSAEVHGEAKIIVEASSTLLEVVRQAQNAVKLFGTLNSSGPGSVGLSSPDASAPSPRPSTGTSGAASGSW
ncbi:MULTISPECIES: phage tail tape measure protein [unclassified Bradyrhizobium]|uniref:phage tail tape measure protein n=1 Tax=unclassified Bradyrhizobium TaxID=2631580 RepID=UPI001FF9DAF7|nr:MULTISPECIES: phage tail tape measure protein [unclassified Bradyrhizobium]MCK1424596.1 phage tail tape measure protein [Bradyrhizobium sp. CW12]MCK1646459.1 phage tail tape measure protein [Bradyrhizobium sp. 154]